MAEVIKVEDCGENIGDYDIPIHNAIIIPRGATNGDVIKAMFPKNYTNIYDRSVSSWWNAPYKGN